MQNFYSLQTIQLRCHVALVVVTVNLILKLHLKTFSSKTVEMQSWWYSCSGCCGSNPCFYIHNSCVYWRQWKICFGITDCVLTQKLHPDMATEFITRTVKNLRRWWIKAVPRGLRHNRWTLMWVDPNSGVSIIKQRLKKLLMFDVHRGNTESCLSGISSLFLYCCQWQESFKMFKNCLIKTEIFFSWFSRCRADDGWDEAESGAGAGTAGGRGEETDGGGEAAGGGRDQEETVVRQLQEGGHLLLLLEHQLLWLPLSAGPLAGAHEVLHTVR